jgi:acetyltransferase-like isoleucine patch superfamily enzyme
MNFVKRVLVNILNYIHFPLRKYLCVNIKGSENKIIIIKNGKEYLNKIGMIPDGLEIKIVGNRNTIKLQLPITTRRSKFEIKNDDTIIEVGKTPQLNELGILCSNGSGQIVRIGENTTTEGSVFIRLTSTAKVFIGEDCMFAHDIHIRASDGHSILDKETREIINEPKHPVIIGNHCWIGQRCLIGKNAVIPNNTIIGMGSVITKIFKKEYTAIAGNPGKIIKSDMDWAR